MESNVSIMVRVRRTVTEEFHVSVPITEDLIDEQPDGSGRLNGKRVFDEAIRIGQTAELAWRREGEPSVEIHPLQTTPPQYANKDAT
jgi:hypothetical protein